MDEKTLRAHKHRPKRLVAAPTFKPLKRGRLPKPLHQIGGQRFFSTELLTVGDGYQSCFLWRNGALLADTAFYGWLFEVRANGLYPLATLHYHPSHKPVHLLTPCRQERDFTNRQLPGAIEFNLSHGRLDPRLESDRLRLVKTFCERCGISLGPAGGLAL
jgi:hypothetical protein